ncbi:MAG: hypothetical protein IK062_08035 [Selenomonadaceae bacterium]|nr:hypothetical protein [Selenomonadaceae bacterium]
MRTKSGTPKGVGMYKKEEKEKALQLYEEVKSIKNVMGIAQRNCYYLKNPKIDKYRELRIKIREIFEENLEVKIKRTRKYNSYKGEIPPAVENLILLWRK